MNCEKAAQNIVLVTYGELPDEHMATLERHLADAKPAIASSRQCWRCMKHWHAGPCSTPRPIFWRSPACASMKSSMPCRRMGSLPGCASTCSAGLATCRARLRSQLCCSELAFSRGNFTYRYQAAHQPAQRSPIVLTNTTNGAIADISGIVPTPNSEIVQVTYDRVTPETVQGSLDDPQIRKLLLIGTKAATNNVVRSSSVSLLANECRIGHQCNGGPDGTVRNSLLVSLRYDKNPTVRLAALEGLQPYVAEDQRVRDAVLDALAHDSSEHVRTRAISLLQPVESDSSVRQVMRTVSTTDENPYIRTVSTHALAGTADIQ